MSIIINCSRTKVTARYNGRIEYQAACKGGVCGSGGGGVGAGETRGSRGKGG